MKIKTKDMVIAALLTSMSILIPNVFPTIPLGPFTATFASHLPVIVAMFISPLVALLAGIGSIIGFAVKGVPVWVVARAAMHVPFAIMGAYMLKKHGNIALTILFTMLVHSILEVIAVLPFINMMPTDAQTLSVLGFDISLSWALVILIGTMLHHIIDFAIAMLVVPVLKKTGYLNSEKVVVK